MSPEFGFGIEQLMELAGLSVAQAVYHHYAPRGLYRALVVCGKLLTLFRSSLMAGFPMTTRWLQFSFFFRQLPLQAC